jgi:hypothetical protein
MLGLVAMFMSFSTSVLAYDAIINVDATVVTSLNATVTTHINFGTFGLIDDLSGGTVDTSGTTSNVEVFTAGTPGLVTIAGAASTLINISVTNATLTGPGTDMTATLSVPSATVTTDAGGAATSAVNGSLAVAAGQTPGSYTGTATVTVSY